MGKVGCLDEYQKREDKVCLDNNLRRSGLRYNHRAVQCGMTDMRTQITDMETWVLDNSNRIYRYWVYKKMFTPYEQDKCFSDESVYEDDECVFAYIREAIDLGSGNWLIGLQPIYDDDTDFQTLEYHKLSDIELAYFPSDVDRFKGGCDEDE